MILRFRSGPLLLSIVLLGVVGLDRAHAQPTLALELVVGGLDRPVAIAHAGDGSGRLFVVLQPGRIAVVQGGAVQDPDFLNITTKVLLQGERGLLGLAFHPAFETNGFFYVNYINLAGDTVIARYHVPTGSAVANPSSETILLTVDQPLENHKGGQLKFGPDGYLYIALGDGGASANGQSLGTLLGKLLRIDVDAPPPALYGIPSDNPFVNTPGALPEIWARGLRNPWKFTFDRLTGDIFIADVGESAREEVDFQPFDSPGGENYGWRRMEGSLCNNPSTNCNDDPDLPLVLPILEYDHTPECSITGGYRYRGTLFPALFGHYLFGDFCSGRIWTATEASGTWTATEAMATSLSISSFGEDETGELYVADRITNTGALYRIVVIGGIADLVIESLTATLTTVEQGTKTRVKYTIANRGGSTAPAGYRERIFLSTDAALGNDTLLATTPAHQTALSPDGTFEYARGATISATTPPGNYFLLVRADALDTTVEENESNNVTAIPITVIAPTPKDLVIENLTVSPTPVSVGASTTVRYDVVNLGPGTVTASYREKIFLSSDGTAGGDTLLRNSVSHSADLPPNGRLTTKRVVTIPDGTTPGNYFVLVQADAFAGILESNEGNNITSVPITVIP